MKPRNYSPWLWWAIMVGMVIAAFVLGAIGNKIVNPPPSDCPNNNYTVC